jgi:hypothetical protein
VTLAVLRAPSPARAVTVRREHVEVPSVEEVKMLDPAAGVAHLKISSFQKATAADVESALRRLDAAGMRSLVIDLRGNPGGLLSAAVDVADLFIERGLVVATRGRSPEEDFNYTASRPGTWRMPLVIVIDAPSDPKKPVWPKDDPLFKAVAKAGGKNAVLLFEAPKSAVFARQEAERMGVKLDPEAMMRFTISICSIRCPVAVGSMLGGRMLNSRITSWKPFVYFCTISMGSNCSRRARLAILSSPSSMSPTRCPTSVMLRT